MSTYDLIGQLYDTIAGRKGADPAASYTASLLAGGPARCAQKMGEEAIETVIAASSQTGDEIVYEAADLIYHLLVVLAACDIRPEAVIDELKRRQGTSGHQEKAGRKN